jgi:hypothetical protein
MSRPIIGPSAFIADEPSHPCFVSIASSKTIVSGCLPSRYRTGLLCETGRTQEAK